MVIDSRTRALFLLRPVSLPTRLLAVSSPPVRLSLPVSLTLPVLGAHIVGALSFLESPCQCVHRHPTHRNLFSVPCYQSSVKFLQTILVPMDLPVLLPAVFPSPGDVGVEVLPCNITPCACAFSSPCPLPPSTHTLDLLRRGGHAASFVFVSAGRLTWLLGSR